MTIPVYRQNRDYDWEVASVYDSDDCDSLGRSASYESSYRSGSLDDPAFRSHGIHHGDYPLPQSQQQHQNYPLVAIARSRRDTCSMSGKRSDFALPHAPIVPPPGVIFPRKDWVLPPQDMYWPPTTDHVAPSPDMPVDIAPMEPPTTSLLLSPSSPPRVPSPLIRRTSPTRMIGLGQAPHTTSVVAPVNGAGPNVNIHTSPIMSPTPRYHELVRTIPPRLADAGCQAHSGMTKSPRRPSHDVLSMYGPEGSIVRGPQTSEEMRAREERYGGHLDCGQGDRPDLRPPPVPNKYEYERGYGYDAGRMKTRRPPVRERRPSIWQRFVRRFSQSRAVSVGHT